jgi:hypothetical protein
MSDFEIKIDRMGELHNAMTDLIVASKLPTSEVLMVLQMLKTDCEGNFRSQIHLLEIQRGLPKCPKCGGAIKNKKCLVCGVIYPVEIIDGSNMEENSIPR